MEHLGTFEKGAERPQKQEIDAKYRTLGRRIYAGLIDGAIFFAFALLVEAFLLLVDINYRFQWYECLILPFVVLYPILTTKLFGGTLGKLYFRLKVRTATHEGEITWLQSVLRELINIVSNILDNVPFYIFYFVMAETSYAEYLKFSGSSWVFLVFSFLALTMVLIEIVTANVSRKRRSVHDFIAGTVVVTTGPYRKWSNFIAIGSFVVLMIIQMRIFNFVHN